MAVDFFNRLLVAGAHNQVIAFRKAVHREYPRTVAGRTWAEVVPFSFAAVYALAPAARRIETNIPCDPYDLSAWPVRRLNRRRSEVRYQFHTRNIEMSGFVSALSRAIPSLTFTLLTWCLDDGETDVCRAVRGTMARWCQPEARREFHWERARKRFRVAGHAVYDRGEARAWAEREMLNEALGHWDDAGRVPRAYNPRRYEWWNRPPLRELREEQQLFMLELNDETLRGAQLKRRKSAR